MRLDKSYRVNGVPWSVSFSGHQHLFVASSDGAYLYPNEPETDDALGIIQLIHPCPVTEGSISRLGHVVATASIDSIIRIYKPIRQRGTEKGKSPPSSPSSPHHQHNQPTDPKPEKVYPVKTIGSNNQGNSSHVTLSADGKIVVVSMTTGQYAGYIELIDWEKNLCVSRYSTAFSPGHIAISDDLRTLLVEWASELSCGIALICARTGKLISSWIASSNGDFASALDAAGETVVLADKTNLSIYFLDGSSVTCEGYRPPERGSFVNVTRCGRKVAAIMADGTIGIWKVANGRLLHKLEGHRGVLSSIDLSNDVLASCGFDRTILVHKIVSEECEDTRSDRMDMGELCEKRFRGQNIITPFESARWIRALIAKTGAAFHVPAADVDEIVEFAVRHTQRSEDDGIKMKELIGCARRVITFLSKCSHETRPIIAPD